MLRIGEFSRLSRTSVKTLRYYEAIALFRPAHVAPDSGYRYYSADQVAELGQILHLKTLGFSLRQIRDAITGDADRLRTMLLERRRELIRHVRDEQVRLAGLDGWLDRLARGRQASTHTVTLKRVSSQPVASIRTSIGRYADAVELFEELGHYAKKDRAAAGPPAAIWHTCGGLGRPIDCEAYVPVRKRLAGSRRIRVYELPATILASVVHRGDSMACAGAYATARSWIASHRFEVSGPKRELYWRGGLDEDRASDITEIQFPIAIRRGTRLERER
jgi:DNA-binding transcriptional MerR regulator